MPRRTPEAQQLYSPARDEQARDAGLVYIEDLALSAAMIALKISCAPQGVGFLSYKPIGAQDLEELHNELVTGVDKVNTKPGLFSRLLQGGAAGNNSYRSKRDQLQFSRVGGEIDVALGASHWHGRPFQIRTFTAGENLDPVRLTGFKPFNPQGFDSYQDTPGVAQNVIDALRSTGDPLSIEVASHEGGRTLARARMLENIGPGTDPELTSALHDAIRPMRDLFDR